MNVKCIQGLSGKGLHGIVALGLIAVLTGCGSGLSAEDLADDTEGGVEEEEEDLATPPLGAEGSVLISVAGTNLEALDLKIQPDGKMLVLGVHGSDEVVYRFETDGTLDSSFGTDGKATVPDTDSTFAALQLEILEDGSLVLGGNHVIDLETWDTEFGMTRLSADGSPDTEFGDGGLATAPFDYSSEVSDMALQSDGKIVLVGSLWNSSTSTVEIALARFDSNGTLDDASDADGGFGTGSAGTLSVSPNGNNAYGVAVAIDADGKIVVGGISEEADGDHFAVSRFTATGQLDSTFSGDGYVTTPFLYDGSSAAYIKDIAIQSDGKIVAAGYAEGTSANLAALVRYTADGSLDTGFGDGGKIASEDGDVELDSVGIQPDGKIVVAGAEYQDATENRFGKILRFGIDGTLDSGFGDGGVVRQSAVLSSGTATLDEGYNDARVAVQSDGKIVAAMSYNDSETTSSLALVRFLADGSPDAAE